MKYVFLFTSTAEMAETDPETMKKIYAEIFEWFSTEPGNGVSILGGEELEPMTTAVSVYSDGSTHDGPYPEAKEVVGGYTVVEAPTMDAALALARTWPPLQVPGGGVQVRPLIDHSGDM